MRRLGGSHRPSRRSILFLGTASATLGLHLPVSIGIAIDVLDGLWDKQLALVDTPGFTLTGAVSNTDGCDGVEISAGIYNDVSVNILGLDTIPVTSWTDSLFATCVSSA